jgi:hypothetical protein
VAARKLNRQDKQLEVINQELLPELVAMGGGDFLGKIYDLATEWLGALEKGKRLNVSQEDLSTYLLAFGYHQKVFDEAAFQVMSDQGQTKINYKHGYSVVAVLGEHKIHVEVLNTIRNGNKTRDKRVWDVWKMRRLAEERFGKNFLPW